MIQLRRFKYFQIENSRRISPDGYPEIVRAQLNGLERMTIDVENVLIWIHSASVALNPTVAVCRL